MLKSVAVPNKPPKVMIGDKHAKYINSIDERHWKLNPSLKSLQYHGNLRLMSSIKPPQNLVWYN